MFVTCRTCSTGFKADKATRRFCSEACYYKSRWGTHTSCRACSRPTVGGRYCNAACLKSFWNKNDYHLNKKAKYWAERRRLIEKLGGKCRSCGISDSRVLEFNHIDRSLKCIPPNRHYTWQRRIADWKANLANIELLCANCHRIHTHSQMRWGLNTSYRANLRLKQPTLQIA